MVQSAGSIKPRSSGHIVTLLAYKFLLTISKFYDQVNFVNYVPVLDTARIVFTILAVDSGFAMGSKPTQPAAQVSLLYDKKTDRFPHRFHFNVKLN